MSKNIFNPLEWKDISIQHEIENKNNENESEENTDSEVEIVIKNIEEKSVDITSIYDDWISIGFAFSDEFGEAGRELFHRVSKFHSEYDTAECDEQYTKCLNSKGQGVSLKSFFYLAKQAGVPINTSVSSLEKSSLTKVSKMTTTDEETTDDVPNEKMPTFPKSLYPQLPEFLQKVVSVASTDEERDILLLGTLVSLSACLHKFFAIYDGKKVYSNLFLFITAQASAGKGRLVHCRQIVNPIHKELREEARVQKQIYDMELAEYNANKGKEEGIEKPAKPPEKMLFISANNSSTGSYQLLSDSDGRWLFFETEGETLAHAFKSDYGNYSDCFRKACHHETISYYRRTYGEFVDIASPCVSTVFSGTPKQVSALIPNAENGLFSRFIFYFMNVRPVWKNVFASQTDNALDDYFEALGNEFYDLYKVIMQDEPRQFYLTADQQEQFNQFFGNIQEKYMNLQGLDYMATIRRLGLIAYRTCMICSALRIMETGDTSKKLICEERDFQVALAMVKILVKHSSKVFAELPQEESKPTRLNKKEKFLYALPRNFNRQKYLEVANTMSIPAKTAEGYITAFIKSNLIHRESQDNYLNTSLEETQDSKEIKEE